MEENNQIIIGEISYEWSLDYYCQFIAMIRKSKLIWVATWIPTLWITVIGILLIIGGSIFFGVCFCVCGAYFIWNELKGNSPKAVFKTYKKMHGLKENITFTSDKLIQNNIFGSEILPFNLLYDIRSSKYGYALLDSKCSGYFIPKGACTQEVISFIENLISEKNR